MTSSPASLAPARRLRAPSPAVALGLVVALAAAARIVLSLGRTTPRYFPDEYLYPELARALGSGHGTAVLGQPVTFPALLEPLLTAPLWRGSDTALSIVSTQVLHATLMALAAVPVHLVARRVGLSERAALACAAVTAVAPGLYFASLLTADALGYLLALTAVAAAVTALAEPTWRRDAAFLAAAGLATGARLQYALLLPVYLAAAVAVERGVRPAARRHGVTVGAVVAVAVGAALAGAGALGSYGAVTGFRPSLAAAGWVASGAFLLVVATGVVLAPGALSWALAAVGRPADRARTALAAVTLGLVGSLLLVTSVLTVDTASDRFIERYLIVAAPLVAVGFACWLAEGRPLRWLAGGIGLALVVVAARSPFSGWTGGQGPADSPTLLALSRLEKPLGVVTASLLEAAIVSVCGLLVVALAVRGRAVGVAIAAAGVVLVATSVGSQLGDGRTSDGVRHALFAGNADWIDRRLPAGERALLVQTPTSTRFDAMLTVLMNPSIRRAAPLGRLGIDPFDGLGTTPLEVAADGRLLESGRPVRGPVVWALGGTAAGFDDVREVLYDRRFALVLPRDEVRLSLLAVGIRYDGKVSQAGTVTVYPTAAGGCTKATLDLSVPRGVPPTTLAVSSPAGGRRELVVSSARPAHLEVRSAANAPGRLRFSTLRLGDRAPGPLDATVANARYRSTPVPCSAQGTSG